MRRNINARRKISTDNTSINRKNFTIINSESGITINSEGFIEREIARLISDNKKFTIGIDSCASTNAAESGATKSIFAVAQDIEMQRIKLSTWSINIQKSAAISYIGNAINNKRIGVGSNWRAVRRNSNAIDE